ncbi:hypothetical protein ACH4ZX_26000 [Streptomyces sp. NPDC020490]|uniref:hypothetical protein n=1 Tax=Streptomyces sp. NPDC020490 TaxID=3365078 RepID=UPI0037983341
MTHEPTPEREVTTGPGRPDRPPGAGRGRPGRGRSRRARPVMAAVTVAVLALGGTVAHAAASDGAGGGAAASPSASATPSPDGTGQRCAFRMAVHGEATVKDPDTGKWVVRAWQRGTVQKVYDDQVTVKSEDGAAWTWTVNKNTVFFHDGTKTSGTGDLKKGENAVLAGPRSGDTRTAMYAMTGTWGEGRYNGHHDGCDHGMMPGHENGSDHDMPGYGNGSDHGMMRGHGPWEQQMS